MADFHNLSYAREVEMPMHTGDVTEMLLALQGSIHFVIKKLRKSQVPENILTQSCRLMIPSWFVQTHGDKFHQTVVLRSGISTKPCRVRLNIVYNTSGVSRLPEIKLGRGWREFATYKRLVVGDSLIFELKGMSEFAVHIFRASGDPNAVFSSLTSKKCSIESELSQKNGNYDSSSGCSNLQHLAAQRSGASADGLSDEMAKKREIREGAGVSASHSTLQKSWCINLHQKNVQMLSVEERHGSHNSQEPPADHQCQLKMPFSVRDDGAQITGARKLYDIEQRVYQQAKLSLPSFIQRLVVYNVQDAVGNTCGAAFVGSISKANVLLRLLPNDPLEIPYSFVMTHGIQLQAAHFQLQGIREESPVRPVTCFHSSQKDGELSARPRLCLGWGDFVRENALHAGQELVFTLAAESFFAVRELSETSL